MKKINTPLKFYFLFGLVIQSIFPMKLFCQNAYSHPWDNDPKAYLTNLATEASKQQVGVQEMLKVTEVTIKELKSKLDATNVRATQDKINKDLIIYKAKLNSLKSTLKDKIKISQSYKSLLTQSLDQIRTFLLKNFPSTHPQASVSIAELNTIHSDSIIKIEEEKKAIHALSISEAIPSTAVFKYDQWIGNRTMFQECKYQSFSDPSKYKGVAAELLFSYTPEEIKKALRGMSYSKGYAFVGKEPGYTYLQLNIEIASDLALQHYGNLNKSFMILKLINGKEIRLINSRFDLGKADILKKTTSISGMYYIDKNDEKALSTSELDSIKLQYATGYEDYVIYNVDFFTRQLACINILK